MTRIPQLELGIQKAISDEPNIAGESLREQFGKLLLHSLRALEQSMDQIPTMVVVIDALDECEQDNDIRIILPESFKGIHTKSQLSSSYACEVETYI
ncbi:hypothetical protein BDV12DRAFT_181179 [Aspergillus spectabilis]